MVWQHLRHICLHLNHCAQAQARASPGLLPPPLFQTRGLVFDWLTHLAARLGLGDRTLYLAFDFLDMFLAGAQRPGARHQLRFFGLASLFIASKYQEIYPPSLQAFIAETAEALEEDPSNQELLSLPHQPRSVLFSALLLKTEETLLQSLHFETSRVLAFDFLAVFASDAAFAPRVAAFAHFLLVVARLSPELADAPRALLGFSALYLSNRLLGREQPWPQTGDAEPVFTLNLFVTQRVAQRRRPNSKHSRAQTNPSRARGRKSAGFFGRPVCVRPH